MILHSFILKYSFYTLTVVNKRDVGMDRLVDVYGRFYLVLQRKTIRFASDLHIGDPVQFELKVIREHAHRSRVIGSQTTDSFHLMLVNGDNVMLHPEEKNQSFDNNTSVDDLIVDYTTIQTTVYSFTAGVSKSGHTISRGTLVLYANADLLKFLHSNPRRNKRSEAQLLRHKEKRERNHRNTTPDDLGPPGSDSD